MGKLTTTHSEVLPDWKHYRVIHSRFPPANVFDSVDAADQLLLAELEGATNDRLVNWHEWLSPEDFCSGPGWGAVMASFCHFSAGRFNPHNFGAYYCSNTVHTAIREWTFHAGRYWLDHKFTDEADATVRCYSGHFEKPLIDVRDTSEFHVESYEHSQQYGSLKRNEGAWGVLYKSVRHEEGLCAGLFRPQATTEVTQAAHYSILWNGKSFTQYAKLGEYKLV